MVRSAAQRRVSHHEGRNSNACDRGHTRESPSVLASARNASPIGFLRMSGSLVTFAAIAASFALLICLGTVVMVLVHAFRR